MVASPGRDVHRSPDSPSSPARHVLAVTPGERTSDGGPAMDGHRGDDSRHALLHRGFPDAVARAMSDKWENIHTIRGYATAWRRWLNFCSRVGFNPVCGPDLKEVFFDISNGTFGRRTGRRHSFQLPLLPLWIIQVTPRIKRPCETSVVSSSE